MRRYLLCLITTFALFFSIFGVPASAAAPSGNCGNGVTWSLDQESGVLTIQGQGAMDDFSTGYKQFQEFYSTAPWWPYRLQINAVVVEDGVTHIGENAFCGDNPFAGESFFDNLTSVTLSDSVMSIGDYAFYTCPVQTVLLGSGLKTIGTWAFAFCQHLKSVNLPDSVITIGESAFEVTGLTEITIPNSVTSIGNRAFGYNYFAEGTPTVSMGFTVKGRSGTVAESYYQQLLKDYNDAKKSYGSVSYYKDNYASDGTVFFSEIQSAAVRVTVNSKMIQWTDAVPFIDENNRTMVPLRAVGDALGLSVSWDGKKREAIFSNGTNTLYFPIGSSTARTSDGGTVQMDTAAVIVNDRTYAPVRYLAEYFGFTVGWDGVTRTVEILPVPPAAATDPLVLYESLLNEFRAVINGTEERDYKNSMMGDPSFYEYNYYYPKAGYAFVDVNQDGICELLIGPSGTQKGIIYDLFTYRDGSIVKLAESVERGIYYLLEDGILRLDWSNGASDNGSNYYLLEKGAIAFINTQNKGAAEQEIEYTSF